MKLGEFIKNVLIESVGIIKASVRKIRKQRGLEKELTQAREFEIVSSGNQNENAEFIVKERMLESLPIPKIFEINEAGGVYNKIFPQLTMYRFQNVEINSRADWILIGDNKAIYDKYFMQQFQITIPVDYGVLKADAGKLWLRKEVLENDVIDVPIAFSLGGTQSTHWGHFSLQYLPKMYEIPKIQERLNGKKLTVIVPPYSDKQIKHIVYDYLQSLNNIEILEVGLKQNIRCGELFYMNQASYIMEHSRFTTKSAWNLSTYSADALKQNFLKGIETYDEKEQTKLYLDRPEGMHRRLKNGDAVRTFFENKGFTVISDAGQMSFEEKIRTFRNASVLVGPEGTAFMNVIFCRPGTKILKFASFVTAESELMSSFYDKHWGLKTTIVCAFHDCKGEPHEHFEIPLERIQRAYEEFEAEDLK